MGEKVPFDSPPACLGLCQIAFQNLLADMGILISGL